MTRQRRIRLARTVLNTAVTAVFVLSGTARAQSVQISTDPQIPVSGFEVTAIARFVGIRPDRVVMNYRPIGQISYSQMVAGPQQQGAEFRALLPIPMPAEGVEGFVTYTVNGQDQTFPSSNPQLNPVRVPALSPRTVSALALPPRQYRMVSVPLVIGPIAGLNRTIGSDDPLEVFGDDFGAEPDPAQWRLFQINPRGSEADPYVEFADDPRLFGPIEEGRGYWFVTARGGAFDVEGGISAGVGFDGEATFASSVRVPISSGWNQIGNPFLFPLDWDDVSAPPGLQPPVAFTGAYQVGQQVLRPWEGYLVFNSGGSGIVEFSVPTGVPPQRKSVTERMLDDAGEGSYVAEVQIAQQGKDQTDTVYLGLAGGAVAPHSLDLRKPPAIDDGLRISVPQGTADGAASFSARDGRAWDVTVEETGGRAFELRITQNGARPPGLDLVAVDEYGTVLPAVYGRIRVPGSADASGTRRLQMKLVPSGTADAGPEIGAPFPNPFVAAVTIPVAAIPGEAVRLEVYDLLGRRVRVVADGLLDASSADVTWDGRNDDGSRAAAGSYLIRLTAGASSAVSRVTLLH